MTYPSSSMDDPDEPYRPRESDHLVEPMFAGLGVGEKEAEHPLEEDPTPPTLLIRLLRLLLPRR